jgi:hypothetical protein
MQPSKKRAVVSGRALSSLAIAGLSAFANVASASVVPHPAFAFRPGPIERPLAIAAGDFDRDGRDDILVANFAAGTLQLLLSQGNGVYAGLTGPFGVGSASLSQGTSGPFSLFVTDMNPNDVDGDSIPNVSDDCPNFYNPIDVTTGVQVDSNHNGVGDACERGTDSNGDGIIDTPIDTDGDGVPDYDPATHVVDNCPLLFNPLQEDADHDGVGDACVTGLDVAVLTTSAGTGSPFGAVRFRIGDGEGGFSGRSSLFTGGGPGGILLADFTGDQLKDLIITDSPNNAMQYFPGVGDGQFGAQTILITGHGPQGVVAADIDGDGHLDLVVGDRGDKDKVTGSWQDSDLVIFRNVGSGLPPAITATIGVSGQAPTVLLSGRLNADAMDDVVVLDQGGLSADGRIEVFLGSPAGTLVAGQTITTGLGPGHAPRSGLLRDLDGDGKLDLVVADFTGGQVLIYTGQGDGTFQPSPTIIATGGQPADVAALDVDTKGNGIDLAILDYENNRILLYLNLGGMSFQPAPSSPASPWRQTSAMAFFGADTSAGEDIVLVQQDTARLDRLIALGNGFFSPDVTVTVKGLDAGASTNVARMAVDDFRFDNRPDLALLDPSLGKLTLVTNDLTDFLTEQGTIDVPKDALAGLSTGPLDSSLDDFDHDGVLNRFDDCPTIYNPPNCPVSDPACSVPVVCTGPSAPVLDCAIKDPTTQQCDSDGNGIGDQCQTLSATCAAVDSDFDTRLDYDPTALQLVSGKLDFDRDGIPNILDNCPTVANADQADSDGNGVGTACQVGIDTDGDGIIDTGIDTDGDTVLDYDPATGKLDDCPLIPNKNQEDNDQDHVGNACVIAAALDNCPHTSNVDQTDTDNDGIGDACRAPSVGLLMTLPGAGEVDLFNTDASGAFHPTDLSPLTGLANPSAARPGQFSLTCSLSTFCLSKSTIDVAVVETGQHNDFTDDKITVFTADPTLPPLPPAIVYTRRPPVAATGDPDALLVGLVQPVCSFAGDPAKPLLRFDSDCKSSVLAAVEPGTSTIDIYLVSNQNTYDSTLSPLVHPFAHPAPLPVPAPLRAAVMTDVNNDGVQDLVALSSQQDGPSRITVFMGMGNGLFFTDSTLNPQPFPDEIKFMTAGNAFLQAKTFYPDLEMFDVQDQAPIVMRNVFLERADIDQSGRVDGYDLALFTASFGAIRGEDFTILPDATLLQSGTGPGARVVGTGSPVPGQDLATPTTVCDNVFTPQAGRYGLSVDINLDGQVDGTDLAILASQFGQSTTAP